jgi:hypothetical protein
MPMNVHVVGGRVGAQQLSTISNWVTNSFADNRPYFALVATAAWRCSTPPKMLT